MSQSLDPGVFYSCADWRMRAITAKQYKKVVKTLLVPGMCACCLLMRRSWTTAACGVCVSLLKAGPAFGAMRAGPTASLFVYSLMVVRDVLVGGIVPGLCQGCWSPTCWKPAESALTVVCGRMLLCGGAVGLSSTGL